MTEITDLDPVDSGNTAISGESLDGAIANMGRMDNTLQAFAGMLGRSIRSTYLRWIDGTDSTKRVALDLSGLPTATTRTWTAPYYSGTLGLVSDIRGQIYGLTLSNNASDPTNDIDIAAGAAVDTTGAVSMLSATSFTKRLDAAWAVGTGNGGRMSAAAIADTTYHVFEIRRPDTGLVDFGFDVSATAPTLPANYTQARRIGSIMRASGAIRLFSQLGDEFLWQGTWPLDVNASSMGTAAVTRTLTVPSGINVTAILNVGVQGASGADARGALYSLNESDPPISNAFNVGFSTVTSATNAQVWSQMQIRTNLAAQIASKFNASAATTQLLIATRGYIDTRGKN